MQCNSLGNSEPFEREKISKFPMKLVFYERNIKYKKGRQNDGFQSHFFSKVNVIYRLKPIQMEKEGDGPKTKEKD